MSAPSARAPVDELTWNAWADAPREVRRAWLGDAAERVGGTVVGDALEVRDVRLVLVPGGLADLGWNGEATTLDSERRTEWAKEADHDGEFEGFLRPYLGASRRVLVKTFLIEATAVPVGALGVDAYCDDPESALRTVIAASGFRLPTNDEWEVAMRAGRSTMFAWGDHWPDGAGPCSSDPYRGSRTFTAHMNPNVLGIAPRTSSYETEVVAERDWLRAGDGGVVVCGGRPAPEAWYSFALAFQLPRVWWSDVVSETFEQAFARRALSLPDRA